MTRALAFEALGAVAQPPLDPIEGACYGVIFGVIILALFCFGGR